MNKILFVAMATLACSFANAQTFTKTITIQMPEEGGSNGASVAWHPKQKKYYAAMAGNASFGLVITNEKGEMVSDKDQKTEIDVRGLWYNPKTNTIEGNAYAEGGWFKYKLNKLGNIIDDVEVIKEKQNQPDAQSLGVYDTLKRMVYFLDGGKIYGMHMDSSQFRVLVQIQWNEDETKLTDFEEFETNFNYRALVYTGIKGKEFGILNILENELWMINKLNGKIVEKVKIPKEIKIYAYFNFSYTNGQYFFFDKDTRTWTGYKLNRTVTPKPKSKG